MSLSARAASVLSGAAAAAAAALGGAFGTPPTRAHQPAQPTAFSSSGTVAPASAVSDGYAGATGGGAEPAAPLHGAGPGSPSSRHSDGAAADLGLVRSRSRSSEPRRQSRSSASAHSPPSSRRRTRSPSSCPPAARTSTRFGRQSWRSCQGTGPRWAAAAGSAQGAIPLGLVSLSRRSLTDGAWVCWQPFAPRHDAGWEPLRPEFFSGRALGSPRSRDGFL